MKAQIISLSVIGETAVIRVGDEWEPVRARHAVVTRMGRNHHGSRQIRHRSYSKVTPSSLKRVNRLQAGIENPTLQQTATGIGVLWDAMVNGR
jgi:hypothetical protein